MCNHSINYVTARSRLSFYFALASEVARRVAPRRLDADSRQSSSLPLRAIAFSLAHLPPALCPVCVPPGLRRAPSSIRLLGNGKKTPAGSRGWMESTFERGRRASLPQINRAARPDSFALLRRNDKFCPVPPYRR